MLPIEVIPYERDKKAKNMYLFMRWFIKQHRKEIEISANEAIRHLMLYGNKDWEVYWKKPKNK